MLILRVLLLIIINVIYMWLFASVLIYQELIYHMNLIFSKRLGITITSIEGELGLILGHLYETYEKATIKKYGNVNDLYNNHIKEELLALRRLLLVYYKERIQFNWTHKSSKFLYIMFNYLHLSNYDFKPYIFYVNTVQVVVFIILLILLFRKYV